MENNNIKELKNLLKLKERTPAWLSRKMNVSTTMIYYWLDGKRILTQNTFEEIRLVLLKD